MKCIWSCVEFYAHMIHHGKYDPKPFNYIIPHSIESEPDLGIYLQFVQKIDSFSHRFVRKTEQITSKVYFFVYPEGEQIPHSAGNK